MPKLSIQGKMLKAVATAEVEITHGDAIEALPIPLCQITVEIPLDHETTIAEWALAPQGPDRWKKVQLQTLDRDNIVKHTWTLQKAYVHTYHEEEYHGDSNRLDVQSNHSNLLKVVIRGTLIQANTAYDGKNILEVVAGQPEKLPTST